MRRPIWVNWERTTISVLLGKSALRAYIFGSVANGTTHKKSDLDIYIAGEKAEEIESKFSLRRPNVLFEGKVYPLHIIGPKVVSEVDFLKINPEARRIF